MTSPVLMFTMCPWGWQRLWCEGPGVLPRIYGPPHVRTTPVLVSTKWRPWLGFRHGLTYAGAFQLTCAGVFENGPKQGEGVGLICGLYGNERIDLETETDSKESLLSHTMKNSGKLVRPR
jgi:hypothetical protein